MLCSVTDFGPKTPHLPPYKSQKENIALLISFISKTSCIVRLKALVLFWSTAVFKAVILPESPRNTRSFRRDRLKPSHLDRESVEPL